jgi:hypothetical protein
MILSRYSPSNPLLLLTDSAPDARGGGAVILRSLLDDEDMLRLVWGSPELSKAPKAGEAQLATPSRLIPGLGRRSLTIDSVFAARTADQILRLAQQRNVRALWIVLHGAMVHVAARLLRTKSLPVHLSVHDDPAFGVAMMSRRYLPLVPLIDRDFRYALERADSVDVISAGMAARYESRYGLESCVIHRWLPAPIQVGAPVVDDAFLEVGVMGNTYGYAQLPELARAASGAARRIHRRARVVVVGNGLGERLRAEVANDRNLEIEVTGHLTEPEAIRRLSRCFALYLNYPFSARAAVLRSTSFPTKLSSYLMAARPILLNAPADSSIAHLAAYRGFVGVWQSERAEEGAAVLEGLWRTAAAHQSQHQAAGKIREQYFGIANQVALAECLNGLVAAPVHS